MRIADAHEARAVGQLEQFNLEGCKWIHRKPKLARKAGTVAGVATPKRWKAARVSRSKSASQNSMTEAGAGIAKKKLNVELRALRDAGRKIRRTPETARAFLIKHGFITKSGKLTKRYGG